MAGILWGLFLILSMWMTGSRSAPAVRSESPGSSSLWDRDPFNTGKLALALRKAGNNQAAQSLYLQGYQSAIAQNQPVSAVRYLVSAGACQLLDYHYHQALDTFLRARELAESAGDREDAGVIAFNLSSLYLQVWDIPSAVRAAQNGLATIPASGTFSYRAPLLLQIGRLHALLKDANPEPYYGAGIEAARAEGTGSLEALGWDLLGEQQMAGLQLGRAERSLGEAFRLRTYSKPPSIGELAFSYARLGALKLAQGDLQMALRLTQKALSMPAASWPRHLLLEQRGRIRLGLGQTEGALLDLSAALDSATDWRTEVPAARSSLTSANIALENQIFDSFIETAAQYAADRNNPEWAAKAFAAVELNRAASLRQSLILAPAWREKLPPKYWELLGQVAETERLSSPRPEAAARLRRFRLEITEMEAAAGLGFPAKKDENFASRASLIHFQEGLSNSELFLSFFLGKRELYLWAVSRTSLRLYRLPRSAVPRSAVPGRTVPGWAAQGDTETQGARTAPSLTEDVAGYPAEDLAGDLTGELTKDVQSYRQALLSSGSEPGRADAVRAGRQLYQRLFGQLGALEKSKTAWLLSLDGPLFEVPFAALVAEQQGGKIVYLVEQHSLQIVPGALALGTSASSGKESVLTADRTLSVGRPSVNTPISTQINKANKNGWFLGVGDPIYNHADARWQSAPRSASHSFSGWSGLFGGWSLSAGSTLIDRPPVDVSENAASVELERLVGSGEEVASSAATWRERSGTATVLTGAQATRQRFLESLAGGPRIIHLATHALVEAQDRERGSVAFSMTDGGSPAFLTTSEIAMLHVPQALVVMSGCETGTGRVTAGAGLLGLTRAWMSAGASAVLATEWPVEDGSGEMFSGFYRRLGAASAAEALRQTQIELVHGNTWRSAPANWASYQLTGGSR